MIKFKYNQNHFLKMYKDLGKSCMLDPADEGSKIHFYQTYQRQKSEWGLMSRAGEDN